MLQDSDLRAFHTAFVASGSPDISPQIPNNVLSDNKGLFVPEVRRLVCSLQVAAVLGEVSQREVSIAQIILKNLQDHRCAPLSNQKAWSQAIAWGLMQPDVASEIGTEMPSGYQRERIVGEACLRLRNQGYKIEVGAYGPQIAETSRREIVNKALVYISLLGGCETAAEILRYLRDANLYHDGLWLFGETGLNNYDDKRPMIPVGWLFSLALCKLGVRGTARKPEIAWKSLVDLVTDFAAAHDCQRYSMFEDIDLHPSQFHRAVLTSTLWRELFSLPQMPPKSLLQVLESLVKLTTSDDEQRLCLSLRDLVKEITKLVGWSADDRLTIHTSKQVEQSMPLLFRLSGGPTREVNAEYGDPIASEKRTQDSTLLFAYEKDKIITMPRAFLAHAACNFVFEYTWSKLGNRAESLIADTLERTIADSCKGKAPQVLSCKEYWIDKNRYEFDVATREADRIVLIETKSKMLTKKSRSGDMFAFFDDYTKSFLRMLTQLVRHEIHLRDGRTPLNLPNEKAGQLRPMKIAISPLSYGPVCDKLLSSNLLQSMRNAEFFPIDPNQNHKEIVSEFNKRIRLLVNDLALAAPKKDDLVNFSAYLIDVFWIDLGQLLYIIDRANTVWDAFRPLQYITFSSRDFWTELACADRGGLTSDYWRPLT